MATSEQINQLVKTMVDAGREDTPELRAELSEMLQFKIAPTLNDTIKRVKPTIDIVVSLTKADLEQRARLAKVWGIPDSRKLIADTAAQWATEALDNGEAKRKK